MRLSFLVVWFLFAGSLCSRSQTDFAPVEYYLVDSLNLQGIADSEKELLDSCLEVFHQADEDTVKIQAILGIVNQSYDLNVWPLYNRWLLYFTLGKLTSDPQGIRSGRYKETLAETINNEGYYYRNLGDIPIALRYYHQSLAIYESLNDLNGMGFLYNNIGVLYELQKDYDLALEYDQKGLNVMEKRKDSLGMAYAYNNIAIVFQTQDSLDTALYYLHKALPISLKYGDRFSAARTYYNLGFISEQKDSVELSRAYYKESLRLYEQLNYEDGAALVYIGLGHLAMKERDFKGARQQGNLALKISENLGYPNLIERSAKLLARVSVAEGNWKEAYEMRNLEITMRDSLASAQNIKAMADEQARYEYEKQQAIRDIEHQAEIKRQQELAEADQHRQNIIITAISIGLGLVMIFAVVVVNRFRVTRRQKKTIEEQKHEVEEKNKEILDSIRYAKRIQNAILPSMEAMSRELRNGFVLYKPKDVVAGDFYWMELDESKVYFAAADCTGHGVPGAMVSVVCSNALSKSLIEEGSLTTGELLDKAREIIIQRLAKSGEEVKDGMDISVCAIDFNSGSLQWSGANNPLWIVRNGEMLEYKADKQPVGLHSSMNPFTTHYMNVEKGDTLYLMTDGFQDQFGGPSGKKFKASRIKEILMSIQDKGMDEQKVILEKSFEEWRASVEQVDDVCVIGVRI